jgi:hypothetical protein
MAPYSWTPMGLHDPLPPPPSHIENQHPRNCSGSHFKFRDEAILGLPILVYFAVPYKYRPLGLTCKNRPTASKSELLWEPLFTPDLSTFLIGITKLKLS